MKLIVLSDLHLMGSKNRTRDLGNAARLQTAIDRINKSFDDADLVVVAGDIAAQTTVHFDNYHDAHPLIEKT